jgi:hypothetical protein
MIRTQPNVSAPIPTFLQPLIENTDIETGLNTDLVCTSSAPVVPRTDAGVLATVPNPPAPVVGLPEKVAVGTALGGGACALTMANLAPTLVLVAKASLTAALVTGSSLGLMVGMAVGVVAVRALSSTAHAGQALRDAVTDSGSALGALTGLTLAAVTASLLPLALPAVLPLFGGLAAGGAASGYFLRRATPQQRVVFAALALVASSAATYGLHERGLILHGNANAHQ